MKTFQMLKSERLIAGNNDAIMLITFLNNLAIQQPGNPAPGITQQPAPSTQRR